jgi:hypothetical protein
MRSLMGFWPTPDMTEAEALVWQGELTDPELNITTEEALHALRQMSRDGETYRPRVGQLVAAVRARRRREFRPALHVVADDVRPLSDPRSWAEFRRGAELEAARRGMPVPALPVEPPVGISMTRVLREMFQPPDPDDPAERFYSDDPEDDGPVECRSREAT